MGLINMQGHIRGNKVGIWSNSFRMDMPRALLRMFFCNIPTSELWIASWVKDGMLDASLANNSFLVMFSKLADICLYLAIISLNILPLNNSSVGSLPMI